MKTGFFIENGLDREQVAGELADLLELPTLRPSLVRLTPDSKRRAQKEPSPDIFISYYHVNLPFVKKLASALYDAGLEVWYDKIGLTGGQIFPQEIEDALAVAKHIGLIVTPESIERPWVRKEYQVATVRETAEGRDDILVPIILQDTRVPPFMQIKHWCDFTDEFDEGLTCVLQTLTG